MAKKISIVGIVGVPANYGGFETLVDNLVRYHHTRHKHEEITVYCSRNDYPDLVPEFLSAELKYIPLSANGVQSIIYDIWALFSAVLNRSDIILLLGVSGAIALPLVRLFSSAKIITNIDGIEWRRKKWNRFAKWFLRVSEEISVRYSHSIIADNEAISSYVKQTYGVVSHVIAYGGDHVLGVDSVPVDELNLPGKYTFTVCRIEPENNIAMILRAYSELKDHALVIVGNWNNSDYGVNLRNKFAEHKHIFMLDPIYDLGKLKTLRENASYYIHGHSAGGTNPSLVEAMHFGHPVLAYDCNFNRFTTNGSAIYFSSADEVRRVLSCTSEDKLLEVGRELRMYAQRMYTWDVVAEMYFSLFSDGVV